MTSPSGSVNHSAKRKIGDPRYSKGYQSDDLQRTLHQYVKTHGNLETCAQTRDADSLKTFPESVRNFFPLYIKQVNAINELYRCLELLLESSKSLFDGDKVIDQVHKVSSISISNFKMLTDTIIDKLNCRESTPADSSWFVEPTVKLRRFSSTGTSADDTKPPFEDEDIDFAGSDIELQLEEIAEKESGSKPAATQSSTCKVNPKMGYRQTLLSGSERPNNEYTCDPDGFAKVYIDGSCPSNGRANAKAGIGVWFGDYSSLNVSAPATGTPTNNNAEIQAATQAILKARSAGIRKLRIFTDSQFLINCMTQWISGWKKNGWMTVSKKPVQNMISLKELDNVIPMLEAVDWQYVEGHKGIHGNERADSLAKQGAQR